MPILQGKQPRMGQLTTKPSTGMPILQGKQPRMGQLTTKPSTGMPILQGKQPMINIFWNQEQGTTEEAPTPLMLAVTAEPNNQALFGKEDGGRKWMALAQAVSVCYLLFQKGFPEVPNWWRKLVGGFKHFLIFIPLWGNDPIWLTFFKGVETTN